MPTSPNHDHEVIKANITKTIRTENVSNPACELALSNIQINNIEP